MKTTRDILDTIDAETLRAAQVKGETMPQIDVNRDRIAALLGLREEWKQPDEIYADEAWEICIIWRSGYGSVEIGTEEDGTGRLSAGQARLSNPTLASSEPGGHLDEVVLQAHRQSEAESHLQCRQPTHHGRLTIMNSTGDKPFSYVRHLRKIRDENNKKMEGMSYRELMDWLNSKEYSDPTLRRWAAKCRQAEAQERGTSQPGEQPGRIRPVPTSAGPRHEPACGDRGTGELRIGGCSERMGSSILRERTSKPSGRRDRHERCVRLWDRGGV